MSLDHDELNKRRQDREKRRKRRQRAMYFKLVLAVIIPCRNSPVESAYAALEALLKSRSGASHWLSALNASHCTTPQSASTQKMLQMRLSRQFPHGTLSI